MTQTNNATGQYMPTVLLAGGIGTGKTHALRTIVEAGLELFVIQTEPAEVLDDLPLDKYHRHYVAPARIPWNTMLDNADKINKLSFKELSQLTGMNNAAYRQWYEVVENCNNFKCDRCGKAFGDVMTWGFDRAIVIDGLSGLSTMALNLGTGALPTRTEGEWGVAMDNLQRFIEQMVYGTKCLFVLCAHLEREPNQITQGTNITVSTLGRKLAPKVPRPFSDVIHTIRRGTEFKWSTITPEMELKARNVPWSDNLPASFVPLIETWRKRQAKGNATQGQ
jgi:hypothetical protein